jgi:hypothetical protein
MERDKIQDKYTHPGKPKIEVLEGTNPEWKISPQKTNVWNQSYSTRASACKTVDLQPGINRNFDLVLAPIPKPPNLRE